MTNLHDPNSYLTSFWDWTPFNECFSPARLKIGDIDGIVERNGHFLIIETKRPNAQLSTGQDIMFSKLVKLPEFNVLIIYGEANMPVRYQWYGYPVKPANLDTIRRLIRRWFLYADSRPPAVR